MSSEKETLMDEIEKSLWNLTEDNLRDLCERCGMDGSEIKGMNHRLLRRKVMEEMWDNTESMKSEEQGMSWLVRLKDDIRRIQEDGSSALMNTSQSDDVDCNEEHNKGDRDCLPSNGLTAEPLHPSQCDDDAVDCDEEWNEEGGAGLLSNTPDQSKLKRHIRSHTVQQHTVNPSVKPHHCSDCGKQFIVKSSLKHHRLVFHTDHPHRCGQCKKSFITAERLESHIKTRHPPSDPLKNPHVCSKCGRAFPVAASLRRHLRTHTGEKPYVCPKCEKDYSDCGNLRKHMRRTHPVEEMVVESFATQRSIPTGNVEEMQDNTDSIKSEEQGTSCSLQLKEDLKGIQEDGSVVPMSPGQDYDDGADDDDDDDDDVDCNVKDRDWLPSNGLKAEPMSPSQSDDAVDWDEKDRDWMASDGLEVELSPERHTPEQRVRGDKPPRPPSTLSKSPGRASRGSALLRCLKKRVSVQLDDSKTTRTGEKSHSSSRAKRCQKTLPGDRPSSHICDHCGKNLGSQKSLKSHMRVHTEDKPHECSECGETFRLLRSLKKHQKLHTGEVRGTKKVKVPHPCPHCGTMLASKKELKDHLRIRHTEKTQLCSECGKRFSSTYALRKHQRLHTGEQLHLCPDCGKTFYTQAHLISHQRVHAEHRERPHVCPVCGRGFTAASSLKSHQSIHTGEKPYLCSECGKSFRTLGHFTTHQKQHVEAKPSFPCPVCNQCLSTKRNLLFHQRMHTGEKPYHCTQCDRRFVNEQKLKSHQRVHTGEKPYLCSQCGKSFALSQNLKKHLRVHSGERRYRCTYCVKSFISSSGLKSHLQTHTGVKPCHCPECGKGFSEKRALKNHMLTHGRETAPTFQCL